jgi:type II secretory pathway component PulC
MTKKYLNIMLLALISAFSINQLSAQEEKSEVKVVVIEKTIDKDGKETVKKIIKDGKEASAFLKEIEHESTVKGEKKDKKIKSKKIVIEGDGEENVVIIRSSGDGEEVIEWNSDDDSIDLEDLMEEHNISIDVDSDSDGHMKVKIIRNGQEEEMIFIGDEIEMSEGDYKTIVHKSDDNRKAQLGVMIKMPEDMSGVEVIDVFENSGAEKAGIVKGDIITKVDELEVRSIEELVNAVKDREPGEEVKLLVVRDGEPTVRKVLMQEYQGKNKNYEEHEVIIIKKEH